jgi:hypothetical protein
MSAGRPEPQKALHLLTIWIERVVATGALDWIRAALHEVTRPASGPALLRALGLASRRLGRGDLILTDADLKDADALRTGWDPTGLSIDQAARIALVLASYRGDDAAFATSLDALCRTAEINESIAYYRGLAIFPAPEQLRARAGEGVRSAMVPIFEAVAHRNPYPREMFDLPSWNQMVVKALFIGSTLKLIQGLDARVNQDLSYMLIDYAHERWAAGRPVSPELWRCVGPVADERGFETLRRVLRTGSPLERHAAVLALRVNPRPEAREILAPYSDITREVDAKSITWADIS